MSACAEYIYYIQGFTERLKNTCITPKESAECSHGKEGLLNCGAYFQKLVLLFLGNLNMLNTVKVVVENCRDDEI